MSDDSLKLESVRITNEVRGLNTIRIKFNNASGIVIALNDGEDALSVVESLREAAKAIVLERNICKIRRR